MKELHGTHESAYEYDGASRRWRITEKENGTQTKQETFVWCGARICQKRSGGAVTRSYFGNGFQESGPTNYFYTRDHLGSAREVVATDGTTVASRLSYDPWGKITETGSGAKSDFTYTEHYVDRATGLNLAHYRPYDAGLGRWTSRDPMGIAGGLNLYGYVNNSPVQYIDPSGRSPLLAGVLLYAIYLAIASPTHDQSVVAGLPIMVAPAVGWEAGGICATGGAAGGGLADVGTVSTLTGGTNPQLLRQALEMLKNTRPEDHADYFEQVLVPEIDRLGGGFAATRSMGADGSAIFVGEAGEVLAIAPSGEMFRGTYMTAMNFRY